MLILRQTPYEREFRTTQAVVSQNVQAVPPPGSDRHRRRKGMPKTHLNLRRHAPGQGRRFAAAPVRDALWEWWVATRYAVDWKKWGSAGATKKRKCICRYPKSLVLAKVRQLHLEWVAAHLMHGERESLQTSNPDGKWLARFQEEFGTNFKKANRRYEVPREVRKLRHEIAWVNVSCVRYLCKLCNGYDPVQHNMDQSPYYRNESGAQDQLTMSLRGESVPVVEGKSASHDRFTVCLSCCSDEQTINRATPFCELMFKAAEDGPKRKELQDRYRTCGEKPGFSVTTAPKGTYRETDIVDVLQRQLKRLKKAN